VWVKRLVVLCACLGVGASAAVVVPWAVGRILVMTFVSGGLVLGIGLRWEGLSHDDRVVMKAIARPRWLGGKTREE